VAYFWEFWNSVIDNDGVPLEEAKVWFSHNKRTWVEVTLLAIAVLIIIFVTGWLLKRSEHSPG
jgi:hypothetical protein